MEKDKAIELFEAQPYFQRWENNYRKKITTVHELAGWSCVVDPSYFASYYDEQRPEDFILNAFNWALTKEGLEYWYFRNIEWRNTLKLNS